MRHGIRYALYAFVFAVAACSSNAQGIYEASTKVELKSDVRTAAPSTTFWAAVHMDMDPEWHVYWTNAGDSGFAPKITWDLPIGVSVGDVRWPFPRRIDYGGLTSYGYEGDLWLWVPVTVSGAVSEEIVLKAQVDWLACEKICIPGKAEVTLSVSVADEAVPNPDGVKALQESRTLWPLEQHGWDVKAQADASTIRIALYATGEIPALNEVNFFPDRDDLIDHVAAQPWTTREQALIVDVPRSEVFGVGEPVASISGVIVGDKALTASGHRAIRIDVPVEHANSLEPLQQDAVPVTSGIGINGAAGETSILLMLVFAISGGLILNLMPCVLPVLSVKVLQLIQHHEDPHKAWRSGVLYACGVVASFLVLSGLLLILRAAGSKIGWGFQFQSPYFVIALMCLFFFMALNLLGIFEVGVTLTRVNSPGPGRGAFLSGVLATVAATPCTAPFMGTALGFSLTQPAWVSLAVFGCIGLGMASPFLILTRFPALMARLPRPGPWMSILKSLMGFLLFAAVIWLVWVLGQQATFSTVIKVLSALAILGLSSWLYGLSQRSTQSGAARMAALFALVLGLWLALGFVDRQSSQSYQEGAIDWRPFDVEQIEAWRQEGEVVFVDFTAAWCLSCQVNDRVVFQNPEVIDAFAQYTIRPVKADWTNHDPAITEALAALGKNSIPVYVVYNGDKDPVFLPEIITPSIFLKTLERLNIAGDEK